MVGLRLHDLQVTWRRVPFIKQGVKDHWQTREHNIEDLSQPLIVQVLPTEPIKKPVEEVRSCVDLVLIEVKQYEERVPSITFMPHIEKQTT